MTVACVSVSGGKDSTATLLLALERLPKDQVVPVFADTGNEDAQTYRYVRDYLPAKLGIEIHEVKADFTEVLARRRTYVLEHYAAEGLPQEAVDRILGSLEPTGNPYLDLCIWKGRFPSRRAQFCTQHLKTEPLVEFQLELSEKHGAVESWQGVRADESPSRARLAEREDRGGGLRIYRPILTWNVEQVFGLIAEKGLEPNPLYREGFTRVGCMPCINAKKDEVLEISRRYPGHIDRIAAWEEMVKAASKRGDASFFPDPEEDAHLKRRGIHAMVAWSKTSRGGVQYDLMRVTDEPEACASAYGLCE